VTQIVWFRQDLRVADNPALSAAVAHGGPIVPVYIWDSDSGSPWSTGAASRWWLHQSLLALDEALRARGSRLVIRCGDALECLHQLIEETDAGTVVWNRRYEPAHIAQDRQIKTALKKEGVSATSFNASLLFEPWTVQTGQSQPYRVFTPFWKKCLSLPAPPTPEPAPDRLTPPPNWPASLAVLELGLQPRLDWTKHMQAEWHPGTDGAEVALDGFLHNMTAYQRGRDFPFLRSTSRLSPYLHLGLIGPRTVWHAVQAHASHQSRPGLVKSGEAFLRELVWREFAYHLLYHYPETTDKPLRPEFENFPWTWNETQWRAWTRGETGFPIVDAGMRELWAMGWMHNRVRMIVGSFLVKDLLIPWQKGAQWFWDTLIDADLASNTFGWQWTAGCGADAAPYFRVFNPVLQGEKFDSDGAYVGKWVPELARLPAKWIHKPWQAPQSVLEAAGLCIGATYPAPIVDHARARDTALQAYDRIKRR